MMNGSRKWWPFESGVWRQADGSWMVCFSGRDVLLVIELIVCAHLLFA